MASGFILLSYILVFNPSFRFISLNHVIAYTRIFFRHYTFQFGISLGSNIVSFTNRFR